MPLTGGIDSASGDVVGGGGIGLGSTSGPISTEPSISKVQINTIKKKHHARGNLASLSWSDASDSTAMRSAEGSETEEINLDAYKPKVKDAGLVPDVLTDKFRDVSQPLNSPGLPDSTQVGLTNRSEGGFDLKRLSMGSRQSSMHARLELNRTDSIQSERSVLRSLSNLRPHGARNAGDGIADKQHVRQQMFRNLMYLNFLESGKDAMQDSRAGIGLMEGSTGMKSRPGSSSVLMNTALSSDETLLVLGMFSCGVEANTSTRNLMESGPKVVTTRKVLLEKMKKGVLLHAIRFLGECSTANDLNSLNSMARAISVSDDIHIMEHSRPSMSEEMSRSMSERTPMLNRRSLNHEHPPADADVRNAAAPIEVPSITAENSESKNIFMRGISKMMSFRVGSGSRRLERTSTQDEANFGIDGAMLTSKTYDEQDTYSSMKNRLTLSKSTSPPTSSIAIRSRSAVTPLQPLPLTLLCSQSLQLLPWELLLPQSRVIRSVHLTGLCSFVLDRDTSPAGSAAGDGVAAVASGIHRLEGNVGRVYSTNGTLIRPSCHIRGFLGPKWVSEVFIACHSN